jgi:RNA polymerase sigma factor (sigma-70 family)
MSRSVWKEMSNFFGDEYRNLVRFVRTLINDVADRDSEDIVQDVALHLFERADMTLPIEHMTSYVYQALRNRVVDYFRRKRDVISLSTPFNSEDGTIVLEDMLEDESEDLAQMIEQKQLAGFVMDIVNKIEIKQAVLFIATEIEGYSYKELSQEWMVPIGTLLSLKSRAVKRIREEIQKLDNNSLELHF